MLEINTWIIQVLKLCINVSIYTLLTTDCKELFRHAQILVVCMQHLQPVG